MKQKIFINCMKLKQKYFKSNKMNFLNKIPGPLLVFLGACTLSFGGLIVKSFEGANLWQILFWRSVFFSIVVLFFIIKL